jgi:predicted DNA-binding transcriptional regulator AlpA
MKLRLEAEDLDQIAAVVRDAVAEEVAKVRTGAPARALVDRRGLASALAISTAALDRLREEPAFPEVRIGDSPRFELDRVLEWLRARGDAPALRVVVGGGE